MHLLDVAVSVSHVASASFFALSTSQRLYALCVDEVDVGGEGKGAAMASSALKVEPKLGTAVGDGVMLTWAAWLSPLVWGVPASAPSFLLSAAVSMMTYKNWSDSARTLSEIREETSREKDSFHRFSATERALEASDAADRADFLGRSSLFPEEVLAFRSRIEPAVQADPALAERILNQMSSGSLAFDPEKVRGRSRWGSADWVSPLAIHTSDAMAVRAEALRFLTRAAARAVRK